MDPSGFEPNLPPATDNRAPMLLQATWIEVGIATPFLLARLYARRKQMGKLSLDDYLMALSLVGHDGQTIGYWDFADWRPSLDRFLASFLPVSRLVRCAGVLAGMSIILPPSRP